MMCSQPLLKKSLRSTAERYTKCTQIHDIHFSDTVISVSGLNGAL